MIFFQARLKNNLKRTKIICTIGPSSEKDGILEKMILSGMNIARLNFSHGSYFEFKELIKKIRQFSKKFQKPIVILGDLCGPKIRVEEIENGSINLKNGQEIILTSEAIVGTSQKIPINYPYLVKDLKIGGRILLDDGTKKLEVIKIKNKEVFCRVIFGGELKSHKGVNFPEADLKIPALTKKDKKDLNFCIKEKVDFIALSFVRSSNDILEVKKILRNQKAEQIGVIAKIEKSEALKNIDEIISVSDGIMVARGDLGVETPIEEVPFTQKTIIKKCNIFGKPVITATQMLESMIKNPMPSRAEATDVANAILDGTDAVMLSGETAVGKFPVKVVEIMANIAKEAEKNFPYDDNLKIHHPNISGSVSDAISFSACEAANELKASAIVAFTESGSTARLISRYRPKVPIIAVTPNEATIKKLVLSWGVETIKSDTIKNVDDLIKKAENAALSSGLVKKGEKIIISAGIPFGKIGSTNMLLVEEVN